MQHVASAHGVVHGAQPQHLPVEAKKTLPIYATLTFVPMVVLQFFKLLRNPFSLVGKGTSPLPLI